MCTLVSVHRPPDSRAERPTCEKTSVRSIRFTMSSPLITSADGRDPRGTGVMCTSRVLLSKAHDDPLYLLNHAYDAVPPAVIREAALEYQTMVWSAKLYNQRLATLSTYHQLTPTSRIYHINALGRRGGSVLVRAWVPDPADPVRGGATCCGDFASLRYNAD